MNTRYRHFTEQLNRSGLNCTINNKNSAVCFLKEIPECNNTFGVDYKYLFLGLTQYNLKQGDIIKVLNRYWLVTQLTENYNNIYYKCIVRRIKHFINFKFEDGVYTTPCIIEDSIQKIDNNKELNVIDGNIQIVLQLNNISRKISYDWYFISMNNKWKVKGFTNTEEGLLKLYCTKDVINPEKDDMIHEIADNPRGKNIFMYDTYKISTKYANNSLKKDETVQLNVTVTKNNNLIKEPTVKYKSNNKDVVTINENGLIKGVGEGTTTIVISYMNVEKVLTFEVVKTVYDLEVLTPEDNKIKPYEQLQIKTRCLKDGQEDILSHVTYKSDNDIVTITDVGTIMSYDKEGKAKITIIYNGIIKYINVEVKKVDTPPRIEILDLEDDNFKVDCLTNKTFTGKYFIDDKEKDVKFTFNLRNKDTNPRKKLLATIISTGNNTCTIKANDNSKYGSMILTIEAEGLKIEKEIKVVNPFAF